MTRKTALIAGSTGLIGRELLQDLLDGKEYDNVVAIVRRPLGIQHPKLEEKIVDFDKLGEYNDIFAVDDVFCCLGTTIKKAKTKEAMWKLMWIIQWLLQNWPVQREQRNFCWSAQ